VCYVQLTRLIICVAMLVVCVDNVVHEIFFNMILDVGQLLEIINNIFLIFFQYAQFFKISLSL
jgi:hypothetical protein